MRPLLLTILLSFTCLLSAALQPDFKKPDFAFPDKVAASSRDALDKALASDSPDPVITLREIINLALAQSAIDSDSIASSLDLMKSLSMRISDPAAQAVIDILQADIYAAIYQENRFIYNRRQTPDSPVPDDYRLWNANQFKTVIRSLTDSALARKDILVATPITRWEGVIEAYPVQVFPTLYDFVARKAISLLTALASSDICFPSRWLVPAHRFIDLSFRWQSPEARALLDIYQSLLECHLGDPAPEIICDIDRIDFIADHLADAPESQPRRVDLLWSLWDRYSDSEYAAEALIAMPVTQDPAFLRRLHNAIREQLKRHPRYFRNNALINKEAEITTPALNLSYRQTVAPDSSLKVRIENRNTTDYCIDIYRIAPSNLLRGSFSLSTKTADQASLVQTRRLSVKLTPPFRQDTVVAISFPESGLYIIAPYPAADKQAVYNRHYSLVYCSDIHLITSSFADSAWASAVNPVSGAPIKGVTISGRDWNGNSLWSRTTGSDGTALIPQLDKTGSLSATLANDRFAPPAYPIHPWRASSPRRIYQADIFTALPLYHPGDTLRWSAVVSSRLMNRTRVEPSLKVTALLKDANWQDIDTLELVTDSFGRVDARFIIPSTGLTGSFSINVALSDDTHASIGSRQVAVSDYKLPTFYIEVTSTERDIPDRGGVTLNGRVMDFSGFPLADTRVLADISAQARPRFWWSRGRQFRFFTDTVTSGHDGVFSVELPASLLESAPVADPLFRVDLTATSPAGESQSASSLFTTGRPCIIEPSLPANIDISRPVDLNLKITDIDGKPVDAPVVMEILSPDSTLLFSATIQGSPHGLMLDKLPSGVATFLFHTPDSTLAAPTEPQQVCLYRPDDRMSPRPDIPVWTPVSSVTLHEGETKCRLLYAVPERVNHIHYVVTADSVIVSRGWLTIGPGFHTFEPSLPPGFSKAQVTLSATARYTDVTAVTDIYATQPAIDITIESFRDRIVPGQKECWTIRLSDSKGAPMKGALILDMYSLAMEKLAPHSLSIRTPQPMFPTFFTNSNGRFPTAGSSYQRNVTYKKVTNLTSPFLNTWDRSWLSSALRIVGRLYKQSAAVNSVATFGMDMADAGSRDEAKAEAVESEADAPEQASMEPSSDRFDYRDTATPLAFFEPMLATDPDGSLTFSFTAPEANTTWQLRALAFTSSLLSASLDRRVVASKPVMVRSNLPRFLRTADVASMMASVMNNSDSTLLITTVVEIFDPANGAVIDSRTYSDELAPASASTISTQVCAPSQPGLIGYRIRSAAAGYSDGEQALVAILPSSEPVIESNTFYLAPDSTRAELRLPAMHDSASVTFRFCENPVWHIVTALPGLITPASNDALAASATLFSAAMAKGLASTYPEIADAIAKWSAAASHDSPLTSMLSRNQDLKLLMLSSTPWVANAASDSERMSRLAMILNDTTVSQAVTAAINRLSDLRMPDGGLAWIDRSYNSSAWVTENFLAMAGRLRKLGYLPDSKELTLLIKGAVAYLDAYMDRICLTSKSYSDLSLSLTRLLWSDYPLSAGAARVIANTVSQARSGWKNMSLVDKAGAALLLSAKGYKSTSRDIVASLRSFAVTSPERGMFWPSLDGMAPWTMGKIGATSLILDAFVAVDPHSPDIDRIRQWLILQKEARDWGSSVATTEVISSILSSGSKWLSRPPADVRVTLGGRSVAVDYADPRLGAFTADLAPLSPSGKQLVVSRQGSTPAWGAIISRFDADMNAVEPASTPDLSIDKAIFRRLPASQATSPWAVADTVAIGDIVRIDLTIRASRDLDYVTIVDSRAACLEPADQLPGYIMAEGIRFYRENRDAATHIFVDRLPKGVYRISYQLYVNNAGRFTSGVATIQSQYAPAITAHSASNPLISIN